MPSCDQCKTNFEITAEDLQFYEKVSPVFGEKKYLIPPPTLCPDCRQQKRMAWRNERTLYTRFCSHCKEKIIAAYPSEAKLPVYCNQCWWADANDTTQYGKDFDFNRSFFEQYQELLLKVPRINLSNSNNENCDYTNYTNYSKDCYLIFGNHSSEKCCYSWRVHNCLECFDSTQLNECKYCYNCIDCDNCYELLNSQDCQHCSQSQYLYNCRGLRNCFLCCNINNKEYCILNKQYSAEEYTKRKNDMLKEGENLKVIFAQFVLQFPRKALRQINCQDCSGDYLLNSKGCSQTFSAKDCQDCKNVYLAEKALDCSDCDIVGWPAELCYEGISMCVNAVKNVFSSLCWSCSDIYYSDSCFHSKNLFGCTGLKKKQYCILNKQYSKEEYEKLVPRIIKNMQNEWGEFFPIHISPFSYNETIAQEYFPLTRERALEKFHWSERNNQTAEKPSMSASLKDVLICEVCSKNYKMIQNELNFYKKIGITPPGKCPDCRHTLRMLLRNERTIYSRGCAKCSRPIQTTYEAERPETVYCEKCYLQSVY